METDSTLFNQKMLWKIFFFYSNLNFKTSMLTTFPKYYREVVMAWKKSFSHISEAFSCIRSQFLWYNNSIKIGNTLCHFKELSGKKRQLYKSTFQRQRGIKTLERF